ncbi:hypothetical protein BRADI_5g14335v3 [Brachypodium distachyon]|uniref:Uncharacterized protein n=1 Tax=Brachypodium distachyon TaxID=15368 RepID=A0A0Q3P3I0_BRADI|nr:hypothetical protein BRADI_5g14335v3 [Brachypodium distachyon]
MQQPPLLKYTSTGNSLSTSARRPCVAWHITSFHSRTSLRCKTTLRKSSTMCSSGAYVGEISPATSYLVGVRLSVNEGPVRFA